MDPRYVHAFVLKTWLEPTNDEGAQPEWRGRIDHVPSGQRLYFRDLTDLLHFVKGVQENTNRLRAEEKERHDQRRESGAISGASVKRSCTTFELKVPSRR